MRAKCLMCGKEFNLGETFLSMEDYDLYGRKIKLACCENLECVAGTKALLSPAEDLGGKDVLHALIDDKVKRIFLKLSAHLSEPTTKNLARLREIIQSALVGFLADKVEEIGFINWAEPFGGKTFDANKASSNTDEEVQALYDAIFAEDAGLEFNLTESMKRGVFFGEPLDDKKIEAELEELPEEKRNAILQGSVFDKHLEEDNLSVDDKLMILATLADENEIKEIMEVLDLPEKEREHMLGLVREAKQRLENGENLSSKAQSVLLDTFIEKR